MAILTERIRCSSRAESSSYSRFSAAEVISSQMIFASKLTLPVKSTSTQDLLDGAIRMETVENIREITDTYFTITLWSRFDIINIQISVVIFVSLAEEETVAGLLRRCIVSGFHPILIIRVSCSSREYSQLEHPLIC